MLAHPLCHVIQRQVFKFDFLSPTLNMLEFLLYVLHITYDVESLLRAKFEVFDECSMERKHF